MTEEKLAEKRLAFLQETITFYGEDTKRRAADENGNCEYKTHDGRKCAIGRVIPDKYNHGLEGSPLDVKDVLPKRILDLGMSFLMEIQTLHDIPTYWEREKGVTEYGKDRVRKMCAMHKLDFSKIVFPEPV